ncbi:MAG: DUF4194 domain-containing protein [Spirochaetales bacterium]|jgi:hypothetical protein|nr:DUF4194 domain-containing protein [Spirochaetales bacterium]
MRPGAFELSLIAELGDGDFSLFQKALQTLLAKTFIIRGKDRDEELYDFTIRNAHLFDAWFSCMEAQIVRDESLGVIAFRGGSDTRFHMGREDTCALLVLRLIYEEKRTELSLSAFPSITVFDFLQKYKAMAGADLRKTRLTEVLQKLRTHKLIDISSGETADMDTLLILYPSLAISVDRDSIDEILASIGAGGEKAKDGRAEGENAEDEKPEDENQGSADQ